jgi:hypothetical protein
MTDPVLDPLVRRLADLPRAVPDERRTAAVRERCHAALARGRAHADTVHRTHARVARLLELGAIAALGLLYASAIVSQALGTYGVG